MNDTASDSNSSLSWRAKDPQSMTAAMAEFNERFNTDSRCIEEIIRCLKADWCKFCASVNIERRFGSRRLRCRTCKKYSWPLAGTFFERMKHPKLYLASILFIEKGLAFSAKELSNLFGTAYATAFELLKKLRVVTLDTMSASVEVPMLVFQNVLLRRCRETPADKHPSVAPNPIAISKPGEQVGALQREKEEKEEEEEEEEEEEKEEKEEKNVDDIANAATATAATQAKEQESNENREEPELSNLERAIVDHLSSTPVSFDDLVVATRSKSSEINVALTMLEFAGLAIRIPGDRYIRQNSEKKDGAETISNFESPAINAITAFISHYYGGISRRYMQFYIGSFWLNAMHIKKNEIRLFEFIANFGTVTHRFLDRIQSNHLVLIP